MEKYKNPALSPEERAEDLLCRMSIEEKMGQTVGCFPGSFTDLWKLAEDYPHGAGQVSCLEMRGLKTLEDAARFQREVQKILMAQSEHHIPAVFHMEGICGAYVQGAASFPCGIGRGASFDPELEGEIARIVGRQERAVGVTQTFAPVLDISRDSRMGRQGESYGEDPALASAMGTAFVRGLQEETGNVRTEAVAKHFLGFHAGQAGIHGADCELTERTLREIYGRPFQAAITEAGLQGIMPCYCTIGGQPVSASRELLTGLLREKMGFDGVAVSDYCAVQNIHDVQKVCESRTEAGLRAMEAGMDVELHFKSCFNDTLGEWFRQGKADIEILNRAVRRILTAKFRMGLFENPFAPEGAALRQAFVQPEAGRMSLRSALESLVLLKNDGVLPISGNVKRIAVIGSQAATARTFYGGYTHFSMAEGQLADVSTMAGLQSEKGELVRSKTIPGTPIQADSPIFEEVLRQQNPDVRSLLEELQFQLPGVEIVYSEGYAYAGTDCSGHNAALEAAREADLVLVMLGGKYGTASIASMGEGIDGVDIGLPACQEVFLTKLEKLGKPVAAVHFNGRPISSDTADRVCGAILEAWTPAEKGSEAIVKVLLGQEEPSGRLPVSVARCAGQIPVYYNHPNGSSYHQGESIAFSDYVDLPHTPRYFFGHGLSYTNFAYSNLELSDKQIAPDGAVTVHVTVENTGSRRGTEVVQLYVSDRYAQMTRPVQELAGFKRVELCPGEKKRVRFTLKCSQLAYLSRAMEWTVEAGDIDVMVGHSSKDICLRDSFRITETATVDGRTRGFYAFAEVE